MSALGPAGHAFEPSAEVCPAGPSSYDTADDAVFAALRQAARERMAAIKRAQLEAMHRELAASDGRATTKKETNHV